MGFVGVAAQLLANEHNQPNGVFQGLVGRQIGHHLGHRRISVSHRLRFAIKAVFGAHHEGSKLGGETLIHKGI